MAQRIETVYAASTTVAASPEHAFQFLIDLPIAVGQCFPDLDEFSQVKGTTYRHRLAPIHQLGLTLKLHWETTYRNDRETCRVWWESDENSGNAGYTGSIAITPEGDGAKLALEERFWVWLSIPKFTVRMAQPLNDRLVKEMTDRYLGNVRKAIQELPRG